MRRGSVLATVAALAAGVGAGCGGDDHPNEPRPPAPIELTAKVDDRKVDVEPARFGAGLAVITVSNQSDEVVELAVDGPCQATDDSAADPCPIGPAVQPGQPGNLKLDFREGEYTVSAGEDSTARPAVLTVGPERPSSQNELLLP